MDPSLPEYISFFRSISSSIVDPKSARKYFLDIGLIELCPVIWKKIEPFIIVWEKELERLEANMGCINCHDVFEKQVIEAVSNLKNCTQVVPGNSNFEDANSNCTSTYHLKSQVFEIQNLGTTDGCEMESILTSNESVLGKRLNNEILIELLNFDNKESKLI